MCFVEHSGVSDDRLVTGKPASNRPETHEKVPERSTRKSEKRILWRYAGPAGYVVYYFKLKVLFKYLVFRAGLWPILVKANWC